MILVLVAIAVIASLVLVGQPISNVFCEIIAAFGGPPCEESMVANGLSYTADSSANDASEALRLVNAFQEEVTHQETNIYLAVVDFTPFMIDACLELVDAQVSPTTYDEAMAALYELEAQSPGSTGEAILLMQEVWGQAEQRNQLVIEGRSTLANYLGWVIDLFLQSGYPEAVSLALDWQVQSTGCFVHWATLEREISDAQIDVEGIRNSMQVKVNAARAAYERGEIESAGEILCSLSQQLDDQAGVHIATESDAIIRTILYDLVQRFEIPFGCEE